jgi:glycosyltransferase involved in cell wall biosynthesis
VHVALNALFLDPGVSGGVETVMRGLVPALRAARPELRLTTVTTRRGARALRAEGWPDVVALRADEGERLARLAAEQVALPRWCRRAGVDLLHSPASLGPAWTPGLPHVLTLHDLTFLRMATFSRLTSLAMRLSVAGAVRDADALTIGSAAARADFTELLEVPAGRLEVIHHGIDRAPVLAAPEADVRARLDLGDARVVLCVAAKRPHKNQEVLLRALDRLPDDLVLVLAGHPEPYDAQLRALAGELGLADRVRFADWVPDADLEALWGMAAVAAFPTRAEGFGLPVAEALAHGTPVACSDLEVLREVGGELVRTFDPDSPDGCAGAIGAVLADDAWDPAAARARAARFTWAAAAERYLAVYDRVVARAAA